MKIFIAGPRAMRSLNGQVLERLQGILQKDYTILVGDANGADKAVQQYFAGRGYANVVVYATDGKARNNLGGWPVQAVDAPDGAKGFAFYAAKDRAMAQDADYGFMLWNGESKGTLNNIVNLLGYGKKVLVYLQAGGHDQGDDFHLISSAQSLEELLMLCPCETFELYKKLRADAEVYA